MAGEPVSADEADDAPRALTLTQPWAWAVVRAGKDVENRRWRMRYRGPVLLHAALGCARRDYEGGLQVIEEVLASERPETWEGAAPGFSVPALADLPRGVIVGRARIVGALDPTPAPTRRWHMPGQVGYLLEGVEEVAPVPVRGQLGLWRVRCSLDGCGRGAALIWRACRSEPATSFVVCRACARGGVLGSSFVGSFFEPLFPPSWLGAAR